MKNIFKNILKDTATGLTSVVKIALSVCLMTGMFYGSYSYLNNAFDNKDIDDGSEFHNVPVDSMDIIVLGSSHAQYSYVPSFVYEDTGLYSYVLGSACQPFTVSYQMLKEALKTQSPELVVMEVFTGTPLKRVCYSDSCYVTAAYQMTGEEKYNTLDYLDEEKAESYYNPLINNHNEWKTADNLLSYLMPEEKSTYYGGTFGYVQNWFYYAENYWYPPVYSRESLPEVVLEQEDEEALNNILSLCKENDMELMLFMVPCDSITELDQAYRYKVWEWAEENNIKYQDYVDKAVEIDFRMCIHGDGSHAFTNGASLISEHLADYIVENYEFDSHIDNEEIERKYQTIYNGLILPTLNNEKNPRHFLERLQNHKGTIVIRYLAGKQRFNNEIVDLMRSIGCSEEFNVNLDYYAIINDNQVVIESHEPISYVFETGEEFELGRDLMVYYDEVFEYTDPFSITVFNESYSDKLVKHIQSCLHDWRDDGAIFWERGYNMYYMGIE